MSRMIFVFTIVVNSICVVSLPLCFAQTLLADSIDEFSGTQGKNGWFYGYYNQSQDAAALYQITDFQQLPLYLLENIWEGEIWELELGTGPSWTALVNEWGHPNGPPHGEIHWTVRRWVNKYNGKVQITGESGKMWFGMNGGDGTEIAILVDGLEIFSRVIQANDDKRIPFSLSTTLTTNSLVDFIIRPQNTDDFDSTAFYVQINKISSQPPQITHTPITSAIQGKEIWFSMDVVDDQDQLKTLAIYARITGERDFTSYPFVVSQGQTKYDMGISTLTQTLDGVEYYIEATDEQGLVGYHRSDDGAHFICVTDPNKKTPVIIIPGIMGTELYDDEKNELIWIDPKNILSLRDLYLLRLMLQRDGITPDRRNRCSRDLNSTCTNVLECPHLPIPSVDCVDGGRNIRVGQIVNINECCFLEGFTAYKELVRFLERNGYRFNKDLFLFGYDWRIDICGKNQGEKSAVNVLHNIIESLTPNCEDKVNIIAHSMGGLLTRSYLQQYADRRIGTVIYLGTPRLGSPKAYAVLRWKESIFSSAILRSLLERETMSFITQNFPSVYQLLPHNDFFIQQDETFEDLEVTLGKLSNQGLVARAREFYEEIKDYNPVKRSFAINGSGQNTPSNFRVNKKGDVEVSPDLRGDGTVPNNSSSGFIGTKDFFVNGKHDDLPGIQAVQEKILKILEGSENDIVSGIQSSPYESPELYKWKTLSPVTVKITDALGNFTGRDENDDIREDIPESQFFVFDHNEGGFLPRDGEYRVEIHALDTGRFTLQFDTIDADGNIPETIAYQEIPISSNGKGELLLSPHISSHQLMLDVDGDRDHDFILEPQQAVPTQLQEMFVERGDVNKDKRIDISDAVSILEYMFSGSSIACPNGANANNDSRSDISDAIYILGYLFLGTERKPEGLIFC